MALEQEGFRWRNDDGAEGGSPSGASWKAAQDSNVSIALDTAIRLRTLVNHSGGSAPGASNYRLEARLLSSPTEDWFEVAPAGSPAVSSAKIQLVPSSNITAGGEDTSAQLTPPAGSPKSFTAGRIWDDESGSDSITIGLDQYTELEWCLRALSVNGAGSGDVYQFRVMRKTATGGGGIAEVSALRNGLSIFGSATTRDLAFGAAVTAGQLLVVTGNNAGGGASAPTVTDDVGTTYTIANQTGGTDANIFVAYGFAGGSGANTAHVTTGAATVFWFLACTGFTGVHATPLDTAFTATGASSSTPSHSITTTNANALIIGCATDNGSTDGAIANNDGTSFFEYELGSTNNRGSAIFQIVTTATSYTIDWNFTDSAAWNVGLISFKPA